MRLCAPRTSVRIPQSHKIDLPLLSFRFHHDASPGRPNLQMWRFATTVPIGLRHAQTIGLFLLHPYTLWHSTSPPPTRDKAHLAYQPFARPVVGLALAPAAELHLVALEVRLRLLHLHERLQCVGRQQTATTTATNTEQFGCFVTTR